GHRRAADGAVVGRDAVLLHRRRQVGRHRTQDVDAGGGQVHAAGAVVGEVGQRVIMVGGGHGDDVVQVVAGRVGGREIVVVAVVAVHVVHEAVVVVVDAVAGDLAGVGPDVVAQVGVVVIDAGVDDGDDGGVIAGGLVPGLGGVDVGVGGAAGLDGVVEVPLRGEPRVVGRQRDVDAVVGLGVEDAGLGTVGGQGVGDGNAGRELD